MSVLELMKEQKVNRQKRNCLHSTLMNCYEIKRKRMEKLSESMSKCDKKLDAIENKYKQNLAAMEQKQNECNHEIALCYVDDSPNGFIVQHRIDHPYCICPVCGKKYSLGLDEINPLIVIDLENVSEEIKFERTKDDEFVLVDSIREIIMFFLENNPNPKLEDGLSSDELIYLQDRIQEYVTTLKESSRTRVNPNGGKHE